MCGFARPWRTKLFERSVQSLRNVRQLSLHQGLERRRLVRRARRCSGTERLQELKKILEVVRETSARLLNTVCIGLLPLDILALLGFVQTPDHLREQLQ